VVAFHNVERIDMNWADGANTIGELTLELVNEKLSASLESAIDPDVYIRLVCKDVEVVKARPLADGEHPHWSLEEANWKS